MNRITLPVLALAGRTLRNALRGPQFLAPLFVFPSLLLAVNSSSLARSIDIPGFPEVNGFLDFQLAAAMTQSLMLSGVSAGIATALDIEGGFFDRLAASPVPRIALVLGRLAGMAVLAVAQVAYFLLIGLTFGAKIEAGVAGVALIVLIAVVAGTGFSALGVLIALRARNASTVQGFFPIVFVALFTSSAFFPRDLLSAPASWIADYNPLSYIADGLRDPIISSASAVPITEGLLSAFALTLVTVLLALISLRGKLREA